MVTMKDIARYSGVSRQTVSAALNGKPGVSPETRARILDICKSLGFQPNAMATALVRKRTRIIAVIVRNILNPFYTQLFSGIEEVLSSSGYNTHFCDTRESHEIEKSAVESLLAYQVDGLIIAPVVVGVDLGHLWSLARRRTPFVAIGEYQESLVTKSHSTMNEPGILQPS